MELKFEAKTMSDLIQQVKDFVNGFLFVQPKEPDTLQPVPTADAGYPANNPPEVKPPVLPQEQIEKNVAEAPAHEMPPQPSMEECRAVLNALRNRTDSKTVKGLLAEYNATSFTNLDPEHYLQIMDRAKVM